MRRRTFTSLVGGVASWPLAARALKNRATSVDHLRLALPAAVDGGNEQVLEHGQALERVRYVERAADTSDTTNPRWSVRDVASVKPDRVGIRLEQPGDKVEQRCFSGAIWPDDAERFALRHLKIRRRRSL